MSLQPRSLLDDVTQFGMQAVNDYFKMSGDANWWEVPERWPQSEIARKIWGKHQLYIWLELPIAKVLGWMTQDQQAPPLLQSERTTGRLDMGLFSSAQEPKDADFCGVIELKRHIVTGKECDYDSVRLRAMQKLSPTLWGIVGGILVGDADQISATMARSLGIELSAVAYCGNPYLHHDGSAYGFIGAIL
jgi:hypothetical protein